MCVQIARHRANSRAIAVANSTTRNDARAPVSRSFE